MSIRLSTKILEVQKRYHQIRPASDHTQTSDLRLQTSDRGDRYPGSNFRHFRILLARTSSYARYGNVSWVKITVFSKKKSEDEKHGKKWSKLVWRETTTTHPSHRSVSSVIVINRQVCTVHTCSRSGLCKNSENRGLNSISIEATCSCIKSIPINCK